MNGFVSAPESGEQDLIVSRPATELGRRITTLYAHINAATYQLLEMIRDFDAQQLGELEGCLSTAHWLSFRCGIGLVAAREKVRVAGALPQLPRIAEAFRRGLLSYSKVRALTRVATPVNEADLLSIARNATAAQAERIFRQFQQSQVRERRGLEGEAVRSEAELAYYWNEAGELVLRGHLAADQGALLLAALTAQMDQRQPLEGVSFAERRALALVTLAEQALAGSSAEPASPAADPEDADCMDIEGTAQLEGTAQVDGTAQVEGTEQIEGAVDLANATAGNRSKNPARPSSSAERFQIHVELGGTPSTPSHLRDGPGLQRAAIERLTCDASLVLHETDASGQPLNVGRKTRTVPGAIRRALLRRDRGCRFPGCSHRRFVDAHHVRHWAHGGETRLDNLVLLCRQHHRAIHEAGFKVVAHTPDRGATQFRFYTPECELLPPVADDLSTGSAQALLQDHKPSSDTQTQRRDSAEASSQSSAVDGSTPIIDPDALTPKKGERSPDYAHINWYLMNFVPTE